MTVLDLDDGERSTYTVNKDSVCLAPSNLSTVVHRAKTYPLTRHIVIRISRSKVLVDLLLILYSKQPAATPLDWGRQELRSDGTPFSPQAGGYWVKIKWGSRSFHCR